DVAIAPGDRAPARLADLARQNRIHAVRVIWKVAEDWVRVSPYDAGVPESGKLALEHPTIDLRKLNDKEVDAEFNSKMLGQSWHFHVVAKAALAPGGPVELEPQMALAEKPADDAGDSASVKRSLGQRGYEYNA